MTINKTVENKAVCEIACSLETEAFRRRKSTIIVSLVSKTIQIEEIEDGLEFEFKYSPEIFLELSAFIEVEKACCPFLNYNIFISGKEQSIKFSLTGPEGTKDFVKFELEMA